MNIQEVNPQDCHFDIVYCDIVHRCNMECANCYLPNRDFPDLDTDKVIDFMSKFKNPTEFRFIGGEPTLHKDLPKIIQAATDMKHRSTVVSNGLRLANRSYVQKLKAAGLDNIYLSMNGFDDDTVYQTMDLMACANKKMKALENILAERFRFNIGCIIVKGVNEHVIDKIYNFLTTNRVRPNTSVDFRNVGQIGRYMRGKEQNYNFEELKDLVHNKFEITDLNIISHDDYSMYVRKGLLRIGVTDWKSMDTGFNEKTNSLRGRLTQNWKVAPFLEHIRVNENGY